MKRPEPVKGWEIALLGVVLIAAIIFLLRFSLGPWR